MFLSRVQLFITTVMLMIILPTIVLAGLFMSRNSTFIDNIIYIFFTLNFMFLLIKAAPWEFTNYYLRYVFILAFLIILFINIMYISRGTQSTSHSNIYLNGFILFIALVLMYLNIRIVGASFKPKDCIKLLFPFKGGKYIITDGGDGNVSFLMNYHAKAQVHNRGGESSSMRYATDIAKINNMGFSVKSTLTKENKDYEIFHEKVYAPCEATVIEIVDGIENNIPFSGGYPYNVGNHIVLKKDDYYIIIGHLEKGSMAVEKGDKVKPYQNLAMIGNGGLSPRPHLHIQVSRCKDEQYWFGESIPIVFNDSYYPVKNKSIIVQ